MSRGRLEGFSDGVFAVAITLLSLDLRVPDSDHLAHALLLEWPRYAGFVVSFVTIGIIWMNHHVAVGRLDRPDHAVLLLNLMLLLSVCAIPFATDLVAKYLGHHEDHIAAAVYSGVFAWMGVSFALFNGFVLRQRPDLLGEHITPAHARVALLRSAVGIVPYFLAIGLAFVSAYLALGITALVALYYVLPLASGGNPS